MTGVTGEKVMTDRFVSAPPPMIMMDRHYHVNELGRRRTSRLITSIWFTQRALHDGLTRKRAAFIITLQSVLPLTRSGPSRGEDGGRHCEDERLTLYK